MTKREMTDREIDLLDAEMACECELATAQDFRIETKIYEAIDEGDAAEPVSRKETLFYKGLVYDFLSEPAEVRVFKNTAADGSGRSGRTR